MSRHIPIPIVLLLCLAPPAGGAGLPGKVWTEPGRTDLHGDLLPAGAVARLGTVRWRHGAPVRAVAFSPSGKVVAAIDADGGIRLWGRAGGERRRWRQGAGNRAPLAFSPDGRLLASGDGSVVHLWDAVTGAEVRRLTGHQGTIHCLAFSPDGRTLASGAVEGLRYVGTDVIVAKRSPGDKVLRLWDVSTGGVAGEIAGHEDGIETVAWSPDGRLLATGGWDRTIRVWNRSSGAELHCFTGSDASVGQVLFLPDGKTLISAGDDHTLRFWDVTEGKQLRYAGGGDRPVDGIALSPDGKTIASAGSAGLRLWDAATGEERKPAPEGASSGSCVVFSPDGRLLAAPSGHAVGLWDVAMARLVAGPAGHRAGVTAVGFTPDGGAYTAGMDKRLRSWGGGGQEQGAMDLAGALHQFAVSPDGKTVAVADTLLGDKVRLVDRATAKERRQIALEGPGSTWGLAFAPDGRTLARLSAWHVMSEGAFELRFTLDVWDATTGESRGTFGTHSGRPASLGFSPDGKRVLVKMGEPEALLRQWDVASARELRPFTPGRVPGGRFTFSPDGSLVAVYGTCPAPASTETSPPPPSAEAPACREVLEVWETATGRQVAHVRLPRERVEAAAFAPDGRLLAFSDGEAVRLWDVAAWSERAILRGHEGPVNALAFSPDGRLLLTGSDDATALLWDLGRLPLPRTARAATVRVELESLWQDLAAADAGRAWRAVGALAGAPECAVPFLRNRLRPAAALAPAEVARLVEDLDSVHFARREKASEELELLGERAEACLRAAVKGSPSPEVRRRAALLLAGLRGPGLSSEELRARRALQVLRHIGSDEALRVAQALQGDP